ncbi:hypothetical protein ECANGB1_2636 [Enterospora canceri]|uniref:Uncharacterized protein n=1 Tax=Enterospora canceri TaxID=1081671 RepID=A0A1Y1S909_9MICR|nr:hypothetical protein ECANGB1_2636 [Enterospora canceri]
MIFSTSKSSAVIPLLLLALSVSSSSPFFLSLELSFLESSFFESSFLDESLFFGFEYSFTDEIVTIALSPFIASTVLSIEPVKSFVYFNLSNSILSTSVCSTELSSFALTVSNSCVSICQVIMNGLCFQNIYNV